MPFRETIEAVLRAKDVNRFKSGMERAAKSVRKFGQDETQAAAQTELLESMLEKLDRQSAQTSAALTLLAERVDEVGDEMVQTATKTAVMNTAMKKSGSNAVFLGKSWAFWKDRLSLTRSEIITTALTMSVYFSPAILAMGSSFAFAALGGGAVAAGGLSSFIVGLLTLKSLFSPMVENVEKITKAQDALNLAVAQYGAGSMQASRANAHLFGVIQTEGGPAMARYATSLANLKKDWIEMTSQAQAGPRGGRGNILDIMQGGVGAARKLMPTFATGANQISLSLRTAMRGFFKDLTGGEMRATFRSLFDTFDKAIGPGVKGISNIMIIFGRVIRATAPFVVEWAESWRDTTDSWRRGTKDSGKLSKFFTKAVGHFKAWWGLAKQLGRTLRIIFGATEDEGLQTVNWLTKIVTRFNDWLQIAADTGRIDEWYRKWHTSLDQIVRFIQHPVDEFEKQMPAMMAAIDKWLPILMTHIANSFATAGPVVAETFINAFMEAGAWAKFFTIFVFLKKFGFFSLLGSLVAANFLRPFAKHFAEGFAKKLIGATAAGGVITRAAATAGAATGRAFGVGFTVGVMAGLLEIGKLGADKLEELIRANVPGGNVAEDVADFIIKNNPIPGFQQVGDIQESLDKLFKDLLGIPVKGIGGTVPFGGAAVVGESGPEIMRMTPMGAQVTPMFQPMLDIPNFQNSIQVVVNSSVQVNRREIARAVADQNAYVTARRGGRPQQ